MEFTYILPSFIKRQREKQSHLYDVIRKNLGQTCLYIIIYT